MDSRALLFSVVVIVLTNIATATGVGIVAYNAGWNEAFGFTTAAHVQAVQDMKSN